MDEEIFEEGAKEFSAMNLEDNPKSEAAASDSVDVGDFSMPLKKKKKKKVLMDESANTYKSEDGNVETGKDLEATEATGLEDLMLPSKKKKKKKDRAIILDDAESDQIVDAVNDGSDGGDPWSGSDRDYSYNELLGRVFDIMRAKNPEMVAGGEAPICDETTAGGPYRHEKICVC